ncbi:MAG: phosphodiester glycosidase family protein [Fervidobacterium sp.]|nr:phosphodiester glycosidase family protein [Fervidobacterium sp.]HPT54600.1 phosphodiester glycosidase family protein [Fervidobacterium sp.]HRD20511.1 phosphodiester glycosidase family protein [Fervidobacterium sp.]
MLPGKVRLALFMILLMMADFIFAQVFLLNGKTYEPRNGYFDEDQLREIGFSVIKNEKIYLIYDRKLLIGSAGDFLIDFETYAKDVYQVSNNKVMVKSDFLASFLNLTKTGEIYYDKPFSIILLSYSNDILTITTSSQISKDFVEASLSNGKLSIKISPAVFDEQKTPSEVSVSKKNHTVTLTLSKVIEKYEMRVSGQTITISIFPAIKKIEYTKKTETYAGRSFIVNYLIADPKYVDITPLIPSKGIGTTATLQSILSQNGYSNGINANYFDTSTGLPIDVIISNGKVLSHRYGLRPVFVQTMDNCVFIYKAYFDITVRIGDVLLLVKGVNTSSLGEVNLYTSEYTLKIPNDRTKEYLVITNNKVASIGYTSYVPKDSYIVMVSKDIYNQFLNKISKGASFSIEIYTDDGYKIKNAVGAGPLLIQDGQAIADANEEKLRYGGGIPTTRTSRTVIAIKDGKVHLITIEGLNGSGMNYDETLQFLLSKKYDSAMMLDGGGSTSMVYNGKYVTTTSPRNIPVAIGIK